MAARTEWRCLNPLTAALAATPLQQLTALRLMLCARLRLRNLSCAKKPLHSPAVNFLAMWTRHSFVHKKAPPVLEHVAGQFNKTRKPIMHQQPTHDNPLSKLIDQRRTLSAQLAGVNLQIAMHIGDRDAAQKHLAEMSAQTAARYAARDARQAVA